MNLTTFAGFGRAFVLVCLLLLVSSFTNAQVRQPKKVLLLEDQASGPTNEALERELLPALDAKSLDPIDYYRESLDTILITDPHYQEDMWEWYKHKYAKRNLDLIISIGPQADDFLRRDHNDFVPGVPVVFCLDINPEVDGATSQAGFTGIWTDVDPVSTVDVARHLLPNTKRVYLVAGIGYFDQRLTRAVARKLKGYRGVDFTYLVDLDLPSLLKMVGNLPKDSIVLYLTMTRDPSQNHFYGRDTHAMVASAANVPTFSLFDSAIRRGAVGGKVTDFAGQGTIAAEMASRVLKGQKPEDIPSITATNEYVFNWKEMQRWGLTASSLPTPNRVIDREPGVWERYRKQIASVLALILLETALVFYLFFERRRRRQAQLALEKDISERKKAEEALMDLSCKMMNAQEEERSRIARELHDDFNQRLGMLAVDLERTALIVPREPEKAAQRLNQLWSQTTVLGSDLNKLSHALHSSVLDVLGLTEGIRSLCGDSSEQGVQVDFIAKDVPSPISPAISLCLFRITQEALRNVKKHSGAEKACVQLTGNGKELVLRITDQGIGFDPSEPGNKLGLGLRSMQERLRSVGGTIEIESKMGAGARLLIRCPV